MWPDLGKPIFWAQANFSENSIENVYNVFGTMFLCTFK